MECGSTLHGFRPLHWDTASLGLSFMLLKVEPHDRFNLMGPPLDPLEMTDMMGKAVFSSFIHLIVFCINSTSLTIRKKYS